MARSEIDAMLEDDAWLKDSPPRFVEPVSKPLNRRARALNIDDLLKDHYKERNKNLDREIKRARLSLTDSDSSENEELDKTDRERTFEQLVESCKKEVDKEPIDKIQKWGQKLFGAQRRAVQAKLEGPTLQTLCAARERTIRSLPASEEHEESAETVISELLASGWFHLLGDSIWKLDEATLRWIFHRMVYSPDKNLERSASNFLCHYVHANSKTQSYWMPSYETISTIFKDYGYVGSMITSTGQRAEEFSEGEGPPHNLGSLLRFLTVTFKVKYLHPEFSKADAENLLVLIATLSLDRQLLCFGILIQECLESILNYFSEEEWETSCQRIAIGITRCAISENRDTSSAKRADRKEVNYLRLTCSLQSSESRMNCLQRSVAVHFLLKNSGSRVLHPPNEAPFCGIWEVLAIFSKADLKHKAVDFVQLYHQMALADIWLWSNPVLKSDQRALDSWLVFLKSCSYQISSTNCSQYASKVRNWASYLLQIYQGYREGDEFD